MNLNSRIGLLAELNKKIDTQSSKYNQIKEEAYIANNWFIPEYIDLAVNSIKVYFLDEEKLKIWISDYEIKDQNAETNTGLIMAGNIPLVGFHDMMCVFVSGQKAKIKLSSKDEVLMKYIFGLMEEIDPEISEIISFVDRLTDVDSVIATGSNNSYRYFDYYFNKIPHLIRKNRNSIAVLSGDENEEQLKALADDIQLYFGLGCRNVSKLFVPKGYDFHSLIRVLDANPIMKQHNKYMNNFEYNLAISLINKDNILQGESVFLKEENAYISRIAVLNFEYYEDVEVLRNRFLNDREKIQILSSASGEMFDCDFEMKFGSSQKPELWDYADGVDTMEFLVNLKLKSLSGY